MPKPPDHQKNLAKQRSPEDAPGGADEPPPTIDAGTIPDEAATRADSLVHQSEEADKTLPPSSATSRRQAAAARELEKENLAPPSPAAHASTDANKARWAQQISGYETLDRLGEGAFGVVLKCRDLKLDRLVAIKFQKSSAGKSSGKIDRFVAEARAAGQLRHPHIVPVYEFGELNGDPYIIYEFIDGQTFNHWAQANSDLETRVELIAQIADALDYAHSLGIVHRDIKPANVMVDRRNGLPHIADFGCAKLEQPDMLQTVDGSVMGTPAYMSPEVCEGFANQADGRADQWAVGVMLYELLVGHRPFSGKYVELFQRIRSEDPKRPCVIDPEIPRDLETITLKCLEKEKQRRYQSCKAVAEDLRNWLAGRPITARRVGPAERTWLWSKRNPTLASLLGVLAACLVLITAGSLVFSVFAEAQKNQILRKQKELAQTHLNSLESAAPAALPTLIENLESLDSESAAHVRERLAKIPADRAQQFPFKLALYRLEARAGATDAEAVRDLAAYVKNGSPQYHKVLLNIAGDDLSLANTDLWTIALDPLTRPMVQVSACALLAHSDPENPAWEKVAGPVIEHLLAEERADQVLIWCQLLSPVANGFKETLSQLFCSQDSSVQQRSAQVVASLYGNDLPFLVALGRQANPAQIRLFKPALAQHQADRIASLADPEKTPTEDPAVLANLRFMQMLCQASDSNEETKNVFSKVTDNPTASIEIESYLVNFCGPAGVDFHRLTRPIQAIAKAYRNPVEGQTGLPREPFSANTILALGSYNERQLSATARAALKTDLLSLFTHHPETSVHSACRWLLQQWGFQADLADCLKSIQSKQPKPGYSWHEDTTGICFAVFDAIEFHYGPNDEYAFPKAKSMSDQQAVINHRFGVATHETTRQAYAKIETLLAKALAKQAESMSGEKAAAVLEKSKKILRTQKNRLTSEAHDQAAETAPVTSVSWDEATLFCNALNQLAGIPQAENVYVVYDTVGTKNQTSRRKENALQYQGYRLPSAEEWEYASRNDAVHRYCFGDNIDLFEAYGWSVNNSHNMRQPVGQLKPNRHGLFDVHGNVSEWCHNNFQSNEQNKAERQPREIRGQSSAEETRDITLFRRESGQPLNFSIRLGFRVARTYPPLESDSE